MQAKLKSINKLAAILFVILFANYGSAQDRSLIPDFDHALGVAGLRHSTAVFDPILTQFYREGSFATSLYEACYWDPWRAPMLIDRHRRQLAISGDRPDQTVSLMARMLGVGSRRDLLGDPLAPTLHWLQEDDPLTKILMQMRERGLITGEIPSRAGVPLEVQQAAALVLANVLNAKPYLDAAFSGVDRAALFSQFEGGSIYPSTLLEDRARQLALEQVDLAYMAAAGQDLAAAVNRARQIVNTVAGTTNYRFRVETAWGTVLLTGGSNDTHSGPHLLIIDTGGDDRYINLPRNASPQNWFSAVIDTHGDDMFVCSEELFETPLAEFEARATRNRSIGGPGSSLCGFSFIESDRGDNIYRTAARGIGSAVFGVALVRDRTGNDVYEGYRESIGFAYAGIGLVEDFEGDDHYYGFYQVQGCGSTAGFGALIDRAGNDRYIAEREILDFPSAQDGNVNVNMAQGAGNGWRRDFVTGRSYAGGIGLLYDLGGDDEFVCGVFGQGTGYWMGIGMLWSGGGDDRFHGSWYVQGASAHFAIGYLENLAGNDEYVADLNMAQGAGHDYGTGYLIDWAGDDRYTAPNLSLGAGNANGIGVFVDVAGNDRYESRGTTLGMAREATQLSIREMSLTLGVFIDLGGVDTYPSAIEHARNGNRVANWAARRDAPLQSQVGVFYDAAR